jgi:branched-chain amino acid aminotransferase
MTIIQDKTTIEKLPHYIWINGTFVAYQEAKINVMTHSLHYSGGVCEGERAYNGKIFKLEQHVQRLIESANILRMNIPYNFAEIIEAHHALIKRNNIKDAYIRPLVWQGSESLNLVNSNSSDNLLIASVSSMAREAKPLSLHIANWRKCHPNSLPPQCKSSGHYNMMIVCQKEAKSLGYDDAILLDWQGFIAECTTTNIFFVKDGKLFTPIADGFLNGITRQTIIELAKNLGIDVKEEHITLDRLIEFDECFVTGTSMEVKGVESVEIKDEKIIFKDYVITDILKNAYFELVRK